MFETCYTPYDVAHLLRHRYGLPVELTAARPTVVCGPRLDAVDMPATLGSLVLGVLNDRHIGPVVADPRGRRWTFLVTPPAPTNTEHARILSAHGASVRADGRRVMLPMSDHGFGWRWACEPRLGARRLPTGAAVSAALAHLAAADAPSEPTTDSPSREISARLRESYRIGIGRR
ncbi:bifunctional DNA primase/polymerase [Nocardia bovistercoris]|uniref:DNA primase/polymerase bifunctional N-terminal domain-containing protein n=1 Tax=Nocardia bovistercoris TaxID=2785916 RepID=A0A931IA35_9NOCA|nr:hypothetical protein [Nocardia bovistercoris]MBH0776462.1 hypothetical protein [Nocardia bovistercoris]